MRTKLTPRLKLWIDGMPRPARTERYGPVYEPATGALRAEVPLCSALDVDLAVRTAQAAFPGWRDTTPIRRARVLQRFLSLLREEQQSLAAIVTAEHGKTFDDAMGAVQRGIEVVEFACGIPQLLKGEHSASVGGQIDCHTLQQPLGVCVGITPFNFPVMVPMWMFPVAIACGNTFILKPSEKVPSAAMRIAELLHEAGLPKGVFNVVHGDQETVEALLAHPDVAAVSFVGSTPVAKSIYENCAKAGKRVQALGGAKNHAVVLPDADLDFAVEALIGAAYGSAGERCMAISAVVAVGGIGDALVEKLARRAAAIKVGPGVDRGVEMGPLVTAAHRDRVRGYVDIGVSEGAQLVLDGRELKVQGAPGGFWLGPTLFDGVTPQMRIYREEIFGPVLVVLRAETLDEAIALVNACPYANGAAVFTQSGGAARRFEHEVEAGMVGINVPIPVPVAYYSFGGWKNSLYGDLHVHGVEGVKFYTRTKTVTTRWTDQGTPQGGGFQMPTM